VEEQDVKGRIISKYTLAINWTWVCGLDSQGPVASLCEHGNKLSGAIKVENSFTGWVNISNVRKTLRSRFQ
jgi:hypothetical protein